MLREVYSKNNYRRNYETSARNIQFSLKEGIVNLTEDYTEISDSFWEFVESQNEIGRFFESHYQKTYESGLFDTKIKRLMAMCGAIVMGCKGCILGQTIKAIESGATAEEIMEACAVTFSLGGTMAGSKIALVVKLLKEKKLL
jgi:AhpD family alkylhydroperoxidase